MPPRPRSLVRRDALLELTPDQRRHLTIGDTFLGDYLTRQEFEVAWQMHGAELLAEFIERCPAHRPLAWWLLEHGEERPIITPTEADEQWERNHRAEPGFFGFLHTHDWIPHASGKMVAWQEPEPVYLRRLGLLEPGEFERARSPFAPPPRSSA